MVYTRSIYVFEFIQKKLAPLDKTDIFKRKAAGWLFCIIQRNVLKYEDEDACENDEYLNNLLDEKIDILLEIELNELSGYEDPKKDKAFVPSLEYDSEVEYLYPQPYPNWKGWFDHFTLFPHHLYGQEDDLKYQYYMEKYEEFLKMGIEPLWF